MSQRGEVDGEVVGQWAGQPSRRAGGGLMAGPRIDRAVARCRVGCRGGLPQAEEADFGICRARGRPTSPQLPYIVQYLEHLFHLYYLLIFVCPENADYLKGIGYLLFNTLEYM